MLFYSARSEGGDALKEPSIFELKSEAGLPADAKFLGWVIHEPHTDEYLVKYQTNADYSVKGWGLSPENARNFKTMKKAMSVIRELEMEGRAIPAPAFDVGKQILVLTDSKNTPDFKNPLREISEQLYKPG